MIVLRNKIALVLHRIAAATLVIVLFDSLQSQSQSPQLYLATPSIPF